MLKLHIVCLLLLILIGMTDSDVRALQKEVKALKQEINKLKYGGR